MRICMDWRSIKFDWNRARAFLVTAEEGSLSAAARALNMTQPTLGRQVAALEQELGVALFERCGKGLELTPSGLDLVEHVRAMGAAANAFSLTASGQADSVAGHICLSATEVMAVFVLPAIVQKLRRQQPGIYVEIIASNSVSDLKRREADIAIRSFRPTQPDLIAKKLRDIDMRLYASAAYLEQLGRPASLAALNEADFIGFDSTNRYIAALREHGVDVTLDNFPVMTENHIVHWELVKKGAGIGVIQTDVGDAEPSVERVLPDLPAFNAEVWLVAHRELKTSRRVRVVYDFLTAELS
ncbi:LysR family transcriptional regulator [Exilibacterium tricleocarpae]|uniref:LysR family transcriptional regulator n=1 Tax=Exilibacterium tricleocarpae TaxID=2591008 RepID=A0A545U709_9GAMM|nr:LysR family transcriptional regulator [Exilibacterium tricleocarpae]